MQGAHSSSSSKVGMNRTGLPDFVATCVWIVTEGEEALVKQSYSAQKNICDE